MTKDTVSKQTIAVEKRGYQPIEQPPQKVNGGYQAPTGTNVPTEPPNDGTSGKNK